MRHIGTLTNPHQGVAFGRLLNANGIKNQVEVVRVEDTQDPAKHHYHCKIWIYDEDQLEKSEFLLDQFVQEDLNHLTEETAPYTDEGPSSLTKKAPITMAILFLCVALFALTQLTTPHIEESSKNPLVAIPLSAAPIKKELLFDWPNVFSQVDSLIEKYGVEAVIHPNDLPSAGQASYRSIMEQPVWFGIYPYLLQAPIPYDASTLFYKIRQGEIWRLLTPIFLHYDIFHIFFNMIWLLFLGKMLENNLRPLQYIALIVIAGIVSNGAQYLMTGPNFLGYSGVVAAYLGFIWIRQKRAPWEGYPLPKSVVTFMAIFIFGMCALSIVSFFTEYVYQFSLAPGIANTAHVAGVFIGILLGLLPFFSAKKRLS